MLSSSTLRGEFAMNKTSTGKIQGVIRACGTRLKGKPVIPAVLLGFALLLTTGFTNGPADEDHSESEAAIKRFWSVYHGNDYAAIPQVQAQLQSAIERDPGNPTLYALLGATHFWHIGDGARDPIPNDPVLAQDMPDAVDLFGKALQLDYYTRHLIGYINDDHLPGYLGI